ncbi:MAG: N-acetylneuraminate synthase family protein [Elusimicrobiota bacterium]
MTKTTRARSTPEVPFLGRPIGDGYPCYVIADVGLNHNGDLGAAKELVRAAAAAGCDAVKFQKRDVANLAIGKVLDAKDERFPMFGATYRQIREHLEFDRAQYRSLLACAAEAGIPLFGTPFDIPSARFLESLGMKAYKLASHSMPHLPLLEFVAGLGRPTILSTGMARLDEVDRGAAVFRRRRCPFALLHCVSAYPTPLDQANLRAMDTLRRRYKVPVGYSGHEVGFLATLAAAARGANAVERHITLDTTMAGFDHKVSLDPRQFADLIRDIRLVESALGDGRKLLRPSEQVTRDKYHVSWVSACVIPAGRVVTERMLALKNPGTGIPAHRKDLVLGRKARGRIEADTLLAPGMFEAA